MSDSEKRPRTPISKGETTQEVGKFWDSHSLADHWSQTEEASFEVRASRRRRVTIDPEIYEQLQAAAHARGLSPETLVNLWISEQLRKGRKSQHGQVRRPGTGSASSSR